MHDEILPGYTRVTDVLYPLSGLGKIDPAILENAAKRGKMVHDICDALIYDFPIPEDIKNNEECKGYVNSFIQWFDNKPFTYKFDRFYCDKYMITGECDGIYQDKDGLVLVDFKTPQKESKTWPLQGSAYSYLAKKQGLDIKRIEFVQLSKTGKSPKIYVYQENFELYLKCLEIYNYFFKKVAEDNPFDYL
jgi:hypothetical protein